MQNRGSFARTTTSWFPKNCFDYSRIEGIFIVIIFLRTDFFKTKFNDSPDHKRSRSKSSDRHRSRSPKRSREERGKSHKSDSSHKGNRHEEKHRSKRYIQYIFTN